MTVLLRKLTIAGINFSATIHFRNSLITFYIAMVIVKVFLMR